MRTSARSPARVLGAVVACTLGGACPGASSAAPTTTTTTTIAPVTTSPDAGAPPMPLATTPLAPGALRPADSDAARLAHSIVALGDGPWSPLALMGQPVMERSRRDLPTPGMKATTTTTTTPLAIPEPAKATLPDRFVGLGKEVRMPIGDLTLTFTMEDGTWEPRTGNSAPRMDEPRVIGITLSGPGGIPSPAPAEAVSSEVMADDTGAATTTTTALVWGRSLSFQQGSIERPFVLTRFVGRAPFQYSPAEHRALEDALIAVTLALKEPIAVEDFFAERYAERRVSRDDAAVAYDFGAGTITVGAQGLGVQLVGPMRLPRLFAAHGITRMKTTFAHNFGQRPATIHGAGFDLFPGVYTFAEDGRRRSHEAEAGEPALARFSSLGIGVKPRQIGDLPSASR